MEEQIRLMGAVTRINSEILDYEITVLHKHEEENGLVRAEQKRKVMALQNTANKLKISVKEAEKKTAKDREQMREGCNQIKKQLAELEEKQRKYGRAGQATRRDMAGMMRRQAEDMLAGLHTGDTLLQTVYLADRFAKEEGGAGEEEEDERREEWEYADSEVVRTRRSSTPPSTLFSEEKEAEARKVLTALVEKADFLVEETVTGMMAEMTNEEKMLLKFDSILASLGINDETEVEDIFRHLSLRGPHEMDGEDNAAVEAEKRSKVLSLLRSYVEEKRGVGKDIPKESARKMPLKRTKEGRRGALCSSMVSQEGRTRMGDLTTESALWLDVRRRIATFRSPDKVHLRKLLTNYKDVLLARSDIMKRNDFLRNQNKELRFLLKNYLDGEEEV